MWGRWCKDGAGFIILSKPDALGDKGQEFIIGKVGTREDFPNAVDAVEGVYIIFELIIVGYIEKITLNMYPSIT